MIERKMSKPSKIKGVHCIACKGLIRGKPRNMTLQIIGEEPKFIEKAEKLGFTSDSWQSGNSMNGSFHKECFKRAMLIWQVAFETRAISPRR